MLAHLIMLIYFRTTYYHCRDCDLKSNAPKRNECLINEDHFKNLIEFKFSGTKNRILSSNIDFSQDFVKKDGDVDNNIKNDTKKVKLN